MPPPPAADGGAGAGVDGITPIIEQALACFGTFEVVITPASTRHDDETNAAVLGYLAAQGRDFLAITPGLQSAAEAAMSEAFTALFDEGLDVSRCIPMLGEGVLGHVAERFEQSTPNGPPDDPMRALSAGWIKRKKHAVVGIHTGDLARGLADATVTTRKV